MHKHWYRLILFIYIYAPSLVLYRTRTDQLLRTYVVPKGYFQNIVKNISKNCNKDRISRTIYKSSLKESIDKCIVKEVIKESNALCAKTTTVLRNIKSENLTKFKLESLHLCSL